MIARLASAWVAVGVGVACGPAASSPTTVTMAEPVGASGATPRDVASVPVVPLSEQAQAKAALWEEDEVVAALAEDCRWDPGGCLLAASDVTFIHDDGRYGDLSEACHEHLPLACVAIPAQSCNPNPCSDESSCYATCRGSCNDCGARCVSSCERCKETCKDDRCRLACAKTCAACRGRCVVSLDHCTTAGCAAEMKQCYRDQPKRYAATTCSTVCSAVQACVEKCPGAAEASATMKWSWYDESCPKGCFERLGKGCPAEWEANCVGNAARYVVPLTEEQLKEMGD